MRRLVDIDEVIRVAKNTFPEEDVRKIAWVLCHTPTVYNPEKIIEELKENSQYCVPLGGQSFTGIKLEKAIDIVKRGGVE